MGRGVSPCGNCMKLETGVKVIAITNMVIDFLWFGINFSTAIGIMVQYNYDNPHATSGMTFIDYLPIIVVFCAFGKFAFDILLYLGAEQRQHTKCKLWFVLVLILQVIYVFAYIMSIASLGFYSTILFIPVIAILFVSYQLWVVYAFMDELKRDEIQDTPINTFGEHYKHQECTGRLSQDVPLPSRTWVRTTEPPIYTIGEERQGVT